MKKNDTRKTYLFPGRWSPFHDGHKYIVDQFLNDGKRVCIGIRDTPLSPSDPYTYEEREEMIRRVYGDKVEVIKIPDIEAICIGRNVGYQIIEVEPPKDIAAISATKVRAGECDAVHGGVSAYTRLLKSTIWLTGLPCSGKTTIAKALESLMKNKGYNVVHLDGDTLRNGLCKGLGFTEEGRMENLRRVGYVAQLMNENKTIVIASYVSPENKMRDMLKEIVKEFRLVHVKCSPEKCAERDVKGMWAKAKAGEIKDFTGVSAPFDIPENAELVVDTEKNTLEECVNQIEIHFCI